MSMAQTLIDNDLNDIKAMCISTNGNFSVDIIIHTSETDYPINYELIQYFDITRNYISDLSEKVTFTFTIGLGDFVFFLLPHRSLLECTITTKIKNGFGDTDEISNRYRLLLSNLDIGMDDPRLTTVPVDELNKSDMIDLSCECIPREFEVTKAVPALVNLNFIKPKDSILYCFYRAFIKNPPTIDDTPVSFSFRIVEPNNTTIYSKIDSIQDAEYANITALNFPTYLQETKGVYNGSIGTFIQYYGYKDEKSWFINVYPIIDTDSFNDSKVKNKCIIYLPNTGMKTDFSEYTFFRDGDILKIAGTSESMILDKDDDVIRNTGTSVVNIHPKSLLNGQTTVKNDNKLEFDKNEINRVTDLKKLQDGTDNTVYVGPNGNMYKVRSELLASDLVMFDVTWKYGNPNEIYPGMPVQVFRETLKDGIITYTGVILGTLSVFSKRDNMNIVKITVGVKKDVVEES